MKTGSQVFEKTIQAGGIASIEQEGDFFWLIESPITVEIKIAGGSFMPYAQDTGEDYSRVGSFKRIEIKNPTLGDVFIRIYVGASRYVSHRSSIMETPTEFAAWVGTQLAGATGQTFTGIPTGSRVRRKALQVTNGDATLRLHLRDTSGNVGLEIFPETSITLPISKDVELYNPNGAPVSCRVSEIWWTA